MTLKLMAQKQNKTGKGTPNIELFEVWLLKYFLISFVSVFQPQKLKKEFPLELLL